MKHCKVRGKCCKDGTCKRGFPRHVLRDRNGHLQRDKYRVRVVCLGVAAELKMKCSGRRNMLGSVVGKRRCPWFANTNALFAHVFRSNTNVQVNYRLPLTAATHDQDCHRKACYTEGNSRKLLVIAQKAMQTMSGYFGGYISKKQKMGKFELRKSIGALPLLEEKLKKRDLKTGSGQLAHVCNRMFTALESKGILRSAPEEFMLSERYRPGDELAAEFIRTFRHQFFHGAAYLARYDSLKKKDETFEVRQMLPKAGRSVNVADEVLLYGLRPLDPRLQFLSPWQFVQHWKVHKLRPPSVLYTLTCWVKKPEAGSSQVLVAGEHYMLNEDRLKEEWEHWIVFLERVDIKDVALRHNSKQLRHSVILVARTRPVLARH